MLTVVGRPAGWRRAPPTRVTTLRAIAYCIARAHRMPKKKVAQRGLHTWHAIQTEVVGELRARAPPRATCRLGWALNSRAARFAHACAPRAEINGACASARVPRACTARRWRARPPATSAVACSAAAPPGMRTARARPRAAHRPLISSSPRPSSPPPPSPPPRPPSSPPPSRPSSPPPPPSRRPDPGP